jgi:hypothetical protein
MQTRFLLQILLALFLSASLIHAQTPVLSPVRQEAGKVTLAMGQAFLGNQSAQVGASVNIGAELATGADGYLYIKTTDGGFFILRPNSRARVLEYTIEPAQSANSRFKIELNRGVARSISGDAVKQSRQNFRFNTPVAAIGVIGTDFTVFTDDQTTRVAVLSGGIVVSGFGAGCDPEGSGPCNVASQRQLLAGASGPGQAPELLQINRGQMAPQLLRDATLLPDATTPPRADEPAKTSSNGGNASTRSNASGTINPSFIDATLAPIKASQLDALAQQKASQLDALAQQVPQQLPPVPSTLVWGRWQGIAEKPADLDLIQAMANNQLFGLNSYFALLRTPGEAWRAPQEAAASFVLQGYAAQVQADGAAPTLALLENAKLNVNFANSSFNTQFELLTQGQRIARKAEGALAKDGSFANTSQFLGNNNMLVQGVLGSGADKRAGYVFQSRIDDARLATGVTLWSK